MTHFETTLRNVRDGGWDAWVRAAFILLIWFAIGAIVTSALFGPYPGFWYTLIGGLIGSAFAVFIKSL